MRDQPISFSVNPYIYGKPIPFPANHAYDFEIQHGTAKTLLVTLQHGYAVAPVFNGKRHTDNFVSAHHIMLDFDTDDGRSSLATLSADPLARAYAAFAYTTPSHMAEGKGERSRLVFILDRPIKRVSSYQKANKALQWIFPYADKATKDAARLFYGSPNCDVWENWQPLKISALADIVKQWEAYTAEQETIMQSEVAEVRKTVNNVDGLVNYLLNKVAAAADGERHHTVWRIGRVLGGYAGAGKIAPNTALCLLESAIDSMPNDASKKDHKRTAWDAIEAGKLAPIS